jgi:uncharacterized protein
MIYQEIPAARRRQIIKKLHEIETRHEVKILYAVEAGSRARGTACEESDYDIRFIYTQAPAAYLSISKTSDTITFIEKDLDFQGWDLKKALSLIKQCNQSLLEWLKSPHIYIAKGGHYSWSKQFVDNFYSPTVGIYTYHNTAKCSYIDNFNKPPTQKSYLRIIQSLLKERWVTQHKTPPPINIQDVLFLFTEEEQEVAKALNTLLQNRIASTQTEDKTFVLLDNFIKAELDKPLVLPGLRKADPLPKEESKEALINKYFLETLERVYSLQWNSN